MAKYTKFEELQSGRRQRGSITACSISLKNPACRLSPGFRNQLDRAALSVSNNIAEGFERVTTMNCLPSSPLRGRFGGEVRSMMAVVKDRSQAPRHVRHIAGYPRAG